MVSSASVALLLLALVELSHGELFTGTIGMVFGGLLGLGAARSLWTPGILPIDGLPIDGWSFLSAGVTLFLLLPSAWRISRFLFGGLAEIGITLSGRKT